MRSLQPMGDKSYVIPVKIRAADVSKAIFESHNALDERGVTCRLYWPGLLFEKFRSI